MVKGIIEMKERIILAPGASGMELTKSMAMHGVNCFNIRIYGAGELARLLLMRSGILIKEDFLSFGEECAIVADALKEENYFGKPTYKDIQEITFAIKRMRCLVVEENEESVIETLLERGIFTKKNAALFNVYQNYMKRLRDGKLLDSVSLIRKAVAEVTEMDSDALMLKEYPLNPLERALLSKATKDGIKEMSVQELFGLEDKPIYIESFKNCYGASNEVESIISDIYSNENLDQCLVAVTDKSVYSQLFFDYAVSNNIPVTFGFGVPIINSNPAKLLVLYHNWMTSGFFGSDALNEMITSDTFNRAMWKKELPEASEDFGWKKFYKILGKLRLTNDKEMNRQRIDGYKKAISEEELIVHESDEKDYADFIVRKNCIPFLETAATELALPLEEFIQKYSYIRRGSSSPIEKFLMKLDMSASLVIGEEFGIVRQSGMNQTVDDIIANVLKMSVCAQMSEPGKLHITDMGGALVAMRENLYLAGLSASKFPGSPSENFILLDADLKLFGDGAEYLTSNGKIIKKREKFFSLVQLAAAMESKVYISYAGLNVSELKKDNASSVLFELYRKEYGVNVTANEFEQKIEKIDYFAPAISATREIGKVVNDGAKVISADEKTHDENIIVDTSKMLEREWSPSAIKMFIDNQILFMQTYMLEIPEEQNQNPFEVISPADEGNLAHLLMEKLANSDISKEEFLKLSEEHFGRYLLQNPPLIKDNVAKAKSDFMSMMEIAYDTDLHREVIMKEEDIHCEHPIGVKLHGFPDRVERLDDGSLIIVDYKTGREVKHKQEDLKTCIQIILYAYMMEQQGYQISSGEFRYIRMGETITCKYDDDAKKILEEILISFKSAITNFKFIPSETKDGKKGYNSDDR